MPGIPGSWVYHVGVHRYFPPPSRIMWPPLRKALNWLPQPIVYVISLVLFWPTVIKTRIHAYFVPTHRIWDR